MQGVEILGDFAGLDSVEFPGGESFAYQRDPDLNACVLSGDLGRNDGVDPNNTTVREDNSYHVVVARGVDRTAVLDGFLIVGGYASETDGDGSRGGGMLIEFGDPTIRNCTFVNHAAERGGAVAVWGAGEPLLESCVFRDNNARQDGGAVSISEARGEFRNCSFTNNRALNDGVACTMTAGKSSLMRVFSPRTLPRIKVAVATQPPKYRRFREPRTAFSSEMKQDTAAARSRAVVQASQLQRTALSLKTSPSTRLPQCSTPACNSTFGIRSSGTS